MTNMHPRRERIAFQIYQIAEPLGWDITVTELAERLNLTRCEVGWICNKKGWMPRLRKTEQDYRGFRGTFLTNHWHHGRLMPASFDRED
jgi:hypothetical protein